MGVRGGQEEAAAVTQVQSQGRLSFPLSCLRLWQTEPTEPMAGSLFCIFFALLGMVFNQLGHLKQHGVHKLPTSLGTAGR